MNNHYELKNDKEINQKLVLVSFLSEGMKREKGKTVGIMVYNAYENQEQIDKYIEFRKNNDLCDFDIETVEVGKWMSFPDYTKDKRSEKNFIGSVQETSSSGAIEVNDIFRNLNTNKSMIKEQNDNIQTMLNKETYLSEDVSNLDNVEELIRKNVMHLLSKYNDRKFFNDVIENNKKRISKLVNTEESKEEEEILPGLEPAKIDYISVYSSLENNKNKMVFTYVDEASTRQKGVDFCFKFRGCYSNEEDIKKRVDELKLEDTVYDICVIPVGVWIPFNPYKEYDDAYADLNNILAREKKKIDEKNKRFRERIDNVKKGGNDDQNEVILTKDEIEQGNEIIYDKIKENEESIVFFEKALEHNRKKLPDQHVIQNIELLELNESLPENIKFTIYHSAEQKTVETS